jgi:hypothetical protein
LRRLETYLSLIDCLFVFVLLRKTEELGEVKVFVEKKLGQKLQCGEHGPLFFRRRISLAKQKYNVRRRTTTKKRSTLRKLGEIWIFATEFKIAALELQGFWWSN